MRKAGGAGGGSLFFSSGVLHRGPLLDAGVWRAIHGLVVDDDDRVLDTSVRDVEHESKEIL